MAPFQVFGSNDKGLLLRRNMPRERSFFVWAPWGGRALAAPEPEEFG